MNDHKPTNPRKRLFPVPHQGHTAIAVEPKESVDLGGRTRSCGDRDLGRFRSIRFDNDSVQSDNDRGPLPRRFRRRCRQAVPDPAAGHPTLDLDRPRGEQTARSRVCPRRASR
jgi:hypothetical protein